MTLRKPLFSIVLPLCFALAAQAGLAAESNHLVTRSQLRSLPSGCPSSEVTQTLGAPESVTHWMDGSRSLVYEMSTHNDQLQHVYVDLGSNDKMVDIQIIER